MTHCFFLGRGLLLLGSRLLLRRGLFLRLGSRDGLLLVVGAELVRALDLHEIAVGHGLLQGAQEGGIEPLLIRGHCCLRVK